jgi:lactoylglutathione lyase
MIDHMNAYALIVRDVRACAEFYRAKVGFEVKELSDTFAYLTFGPKGSPGLALVEERGIRPELADQTQAIAMGGLSRGYVAVFLEDADRAYEELRAKGVTFVTPPTTRPDGQRYAFFTDPEGNLWEISHFPKE